MNKTVSLCIAMLLLALCVTGCQSGGESSVPDESAVTTLSTAATSTETTATTTVPTTTTTKAPSTIATKAPTTTTTTEAPTTTATKALTTTTTSKATTVDWKKHYISKQILRDNTYQNGVDVTGQEER